MQLILGGAFAMGVLVFAVIVVVLNQNPPATPTLPAGVAPAAPPAPGLLGIDPQYELLFMVAGGSALLLVPMSFAVRMAMSGGTSSSGEEGLERRVSGFLVGAAMCEGPAVFGCVVMLLAEQTAPPVYVAAVGLLGIFAHTALPVFRVERDPNTTRYNVGA